MAKKVETYSSEELEFEDAPIHSESLQFVEEKPGLAESFKAGILGKDSQVGFNTGNIAEEVGRNILPTVGGIAGSFASPIAGTAAGAAAGKSVQNLIQNVASITDPSIVQKGPVELVADVGTEAAINAAGAKVAPMVAKASASAIKATGKGAAQFLGRVFTGITPESMARMIDYPSEVWSKITPSSYALPNLAKEFKEIIRENTEAAEKSYADIINNVVKNSNKYGENFRLNISEALDPVLNDIRKQFGYGLPNRISNNVEAQEFANVFNGINQMRSATVEEAYYLQRDLTHMIKANEGKPIASALGKIKNALMGDGGIFEQAVPEIKQANIIYRNAHVLDDELSKVLNADDAAATIKRALKNKGELHDAIMESANNVAGARKQLEAMRDTMAGQEFAPLVRNIPDTGWKAGIVGGGIYAAAKAPLALMAAPLLSPRFVGASAFAASKTGKVISDFLERNGRQVTPIAIAMAKEALGSKLNLVNSYASEINANAKNGNIDKAEKLRDKMDNMINNTIQKKKAK